ncbi:pre-mRNA 3'-end-processing factor FIP1 [Notolabrus celidotus]|uniref:pre-mRNA 3'-end-processing factor FIP1 n=1 Tax=Notolabrus celidotus TaxID=1203425 RepID=UPI0014902EB2|nr:pre-mRNA 3'-end-processing factor FIP1 [Notolabrus celidotus]
MHNKDQEEEKEVAQSPSRSEHIADDERSSHEAGTSSGGTTDRQREQRPVLHIDTKRHPSEDENTQDIPAKKKKKKKTQRKPWREPGADITDYFNYGFDEESWNIYHQKQAQIHAANRKLIGLSMVQKGRSTPEERKPAPSSSSCPAPTLAHRRSSSSHVIGRPRLCRSEEHGCFTYKGDQFQVVKETFAEDSITSYILPSSPDGGSLFGYNPLPRFPLRPGPSPLCRRASDSENSKRHDEPSTSGTRSSSGVTSLIQQRGACSVGVINSAKTWERFIQQEQCEEDSSREHRYDGYKRGGNDREWENSSSAYSRKEPKKRKKTKKPKKKKQSSERASEGTEGGEERRHRDKPDGGEKSSHSGSSRSRGDTEKDQDSQRSHKPKKSKRKKKEKEEKKTFCADPERKLPSE